MLLEGIIYASAIADDSSSTDRLATAVKDFIDTCGATNSLLWSLSYLHSGPVLDAASSYPPLNKVSSQILVFPAKPYDISFQDGILDAVNEAWKIVLGPDAAESSFLRFEEREFEAQD